MVQLWPPKKKKLWYKQLDNIPSKNPRKKGRNQRECLRDKGLVTQKTRNKIQ